MFAGLAVACAIACGKDHSRTDRQLLDRDAALTEIARLQALVRQRPGNRESLAKLATQYRAVGDYDNAQRSFARVLEIGKDRGIALQLVSLLYRRGRFVEAVAVSKQFGLGEDGAAGLQWLRDLIALDDVSSRHRPAPGGVAEQQQAELKNSIGMVLVSVSGGRFDRGCVRRSVSSTWLATFESGAWTITTRPITGGRPSGTRWGPKEKAVSKCFAVAPGTIRADQGLR
jgi:hypothetical protein